MKTFPKSSPRPFDRTPSMTKVRQIPVEIFLFGLIAALFMWEAAVPVFGQTTYTWTSDGTGGTWTTTSNWTPTSGTGTTFPSASGDTAILGDASANRIVALSSNETITSLSINQTSAFTNKLVLGGSELTLSSATPLNIASSGGTAQIYLDNMDNTATTELIDAAGVTVGAGGVLELSSSASKASSVVAPLTINSGGILDIDQGSTGGSSTVEQITGNFTLNSGGTIYLSSVNSGGTALTNPTGTFDTRFTISGNFIDNGGAISIAHATGTTTNEIYFSGGTSATFMAGSTGLTSLTGLFWAGAATGASSYSISSDVALPVITMRADTAGTDTLTIGAVTPGGTFQAAGIVIYQNTGIINQLSLSSNVTLNAAGAGVTTTHPITGASVIINTNSYSLDVTASGTETFLTSTSNTNNWTLEGIVGSIKATSFNLTGYSGSTVNTTYTTNVDAGLTLMAVGGSALINNLGNAAAGSSIDPTSTFEYTGTSATNENFLTSNLAIGNLQVGTGSGSPILGVSSAALTVGGNITVNTGASLDLDGQNITETHGATATAGGLSGAGTIYNNLTGTASTLTLDTTQGSGTFSGIIKDHVTGTGTVSLVVTGSGTNTQTLSGANTYSGGTTVSSGTLIVGNGTSGSLANTSAIHVTGGSFLFNQGATFNTAATVTAGGTAPTPAVLGFTSTATGGNTIRLGALSLIASSVTAIDFGSANINTLIFNQGTAAIGLAGSTVLDIYHYVAGDVVEFSGSTTANAADTISQVQFFSGAVGSSTSIGFGQAVAFGSGFEIVPSAAAPEPSTIVVGLCFLGLLLGSQFAFGAKEERALSVA